VFRVALRLLLAAALGAAPSLVRADTWRWVDEGGVTHYATDRSEIPSRYRDAAQVIQTPNRGISNPSGARPPEPPARPPEPKPAQAEPAAPVEAAPPAPESRPAPPPESQSAAPPAQPASEVTPAARPSDDPRADEIAQLEGQIERDREALRQLISTPRWDSAELASDPRVREIAERLPRLQAELAALRTESGR